MRNPQGGVPEVESWGRNPARGISKKDHLKRDLRVGILEEGPWKKDSRALGAPPESPGGTSRGPLEPSRISLEPPGPLSELRGKVC